MHTEGEAAVVKLPMGQGRHTMSLSLEQAAAIILLLLEQLLLQGVHTMSAVAVHFCEIKLCCVVGCAEEGQSVEQGEQTESLTAVQLELRNQPLSHVLHGEQVISSSRVHAAEMK